MKVSASRLGIEQGSVLLFSDFQDGGPMWTGDGPREVRSAVTFAESFTQAPAVMVGIALWDMDRRTNLRAEIGADRITAKGFDVVFRTWGDSRVARIRAEWTALGPVSDDDTWDV